MSRDEEDVREIRLPLQRQFRAEEYSGFLEFWAEGFAMARDADELIDLAKSDKSFRIGVLRHMRNSAWWIRNHRVASAKGVLHHVRTYSADHHLLLFAGVHPLLMDVFLTFYMTECSCKGDCVALEFDPLEVPTTARLCDKLFRTVHETMAQPRGH